MVFLPTLPTSPWGLRREEGSQKGCGQGGREGAGAEALVEELKLCPGREELLGPGPSEGGGKPVIFGRGRVVVGKKTSKVGRAPLMDGPGVILTVWPPSPGLAWL